MKIMAIRTVFMFLRKPILPIRCISDYGKVSDAENGEFRVENDDNVVISQGAKRILKV